MSEDFDLQHWLDSIGLGDHAPAFAQHHITATELVQLTDEDLQRLGIVSPEQRQVFFSAIAGSSGGHQEAPPQPAPGFDPSGKSQFTIPSAGGAQVPPANEPSGSRPSRPFIPPPSAPSFAEVPAAAPAAEPHAPAATQYVAHHAPVQEPPHRRGFFAKLVASKFLFVSIIAHLLFGLGATLYIVQNIQAKRKVTFQGGPPSVNASTRALEHKVSMAQKKKSGGAPPQAKRIVSAGIAKVSLPDMPSIPSASNVVPGMMSGMGGAGFGAGMGFGSGMGGGMGGGGGGGGLTMFGVRGAGPGLVGTFYDLKQTPARKPTDMAGGPGGVDLRSPQALRYKEVVASFVRSWNPSMLNGYFSAPGKVSTAQLFIPQILADEAPKAFQVEKEVEGRRWLVHYQGEILAPRDGRFRFVGSGDDILVVRCKGRNVLDGSFGEYRVLADTNEDNNIGPAPVTPLCAGKWIEMRKGEAMKLEVLIGENPGGHFTCFLMIEEHGVAHPPGIFPVFQLKAMDVPRGVAPRHHGAIVFTSRAAGGSLMDSLRR